MFDKKAYMKKWYAEHPTYQRDWESKHPEVRKNWRDNHREHISEQQKEYRERNRDMIRYKKHLIYIYGSGEWQSHYNQEDIPAYTKQWEEQCQRKAQKKN